MLLRRALCLCRIINVDKMTIKLNSRERKTVAAVDGVRASWSRLGGRCRGRGGGWLVGGSARKRYGSVRGALGGHWIRTKAHFMVVGVLLK